MDTNDNDHFEQEKRNENLLSFNPPNLSSDWQFNYSNLTNTSFTNANHVPIYKGKPIETSSSSSHPMIESFGKTIWDHPMNIPNLDFCDMSNLNNASTNTHMGWALTSPTVRENMFLPPGPGLFPADSGFIERAARFSSFGRGNFSNLINPYGNLEGENPYLRGNSAVMMQHPQEQLVRNDLKSVSGEKSPKDDVKNVSLLAEKSEKSPMKNEGKNNSWGQSGNKEKQGGVVSDNESDEAEFSGRGSDGLKKRKRDDQGNKLGQKEDDISKEKTDSQAKGDQNRTPTNKANTGIQDSQASDTPKEEYIHIRARRGQATNSHSLAERVRREKISERMKFLQDLVPGCNKVTGKAVMLDEIINYVQSLQRQVEFLSMKLATVNPRLDFNLDSVLAKEPRVGPSSSLRYSPDMSTMAFPQLPPSQPGFIHPGVATSSNALRMSITSHLTAMSQGYNKQPVQVPNMWAEDELHNVVQIGLNSNIPLDNIQDLNEETIPQLLNDVPTRSCAIITTYVDMDTWTLPLNLNHSFITNCMDGVYGFN